MKIPDFNLSPALVRLWLVLSLAAAASLADVADFAASQPLAAFALPGIACLAALKATVLTFLFAICRRSLWLKAIAFVIIAAFFILSLVNGGCWLFYGFGFSMKLFTIVAETNPTEIVEFMPELGAKLVALATDPWLWVVMAVFAAAWIWIPKLSSKMLTVIAVVLSLIGSVYLAVMVVPAQFGRSSHSIFARSGRCLYKYIDTRRQIKILQAMKRPLPYVDSLSSRLAAERIVVVIGESASKAHLSIYGYPLPTTPRLDSIRDQLFIFSDAVASSTSTAENMPRLLTFMSDYPGDKEWFEYPSLLQIFNYIGYRTYWLSNQENSGRWSNLSSIISSDADVVRYVGSQDSDDHYLYRYDDALLPEWQKALEANDSLQLTLIHLMGSHFQYYRRYPSSRRHFKGDDVMSALPRKWLSDNKSETAANYDNSILYTDSILSLFVEGVRQMDQTAILIYVSDHGENVYDDRDYRGRDPKFVDVPFIIYANDAYSTRNPEEIASLKNALDTPFSTSVLPQMLMRLAGVDYFLYDSVSDPLSHSFRKRKRWVDDQPYFRDCN